MIFLAIDLLREGFLRRSSLASDSTQIVCRHKRKVRQEMRGETRLRVSGRYYSLLVVGKSNGRPTPLLYFLLLSYNGTLLLTVLCPPDEDWLGVLCSLLLHHSRDWLGGEGWIVPYMHIPLYRDFFRTNL